MPPPKARSKKRAPSASSPGLVHLGHPSPTHHFEDVKRGLHGLLRHERHTDLHFLCHGTSDEDSEELPNTPTVVWAHKDILRNYSKLIESLCKIADAKQPGCTVYFSCPGIESTTVQKLIDYVYKGQTTLHSKGQRAKLQELLDVLQMELKLEEDCSTSDSGSDSSYGDAPAPSKKASLGKGKKTKEVADDVPSRGRPRPGPASRLPKKKKEESRARRPTPRSSRSRSRSSSDEEGESDSPHKNDDDDSQTKKRLEDQCRRKKAQVNISQSEIRSAEQYMARNAQIGAAASASDDSDAVDSCKRRGSFSKVANPLFVSSNKQPTPQKRRMTESDKKVATKESKKMRQEDDSSSDFDSDAVAKRKKEFAIEKSASFAADSSDSDVDEPKKTRPNRKKSGPGSKMEDDRSENGAKSKKKSRHSNKNGEGMFVTEAILSCPECGAIFLTGEALSEHKANSHAGSKGSSDDAASSSESSDSSCSSRTKKNAAKKTPSKIKEERRKSKRSTSSEEEEKRDSDDDEPLPAKRKPAPKATKPKKVTVQLTERKTTTPSRKKSLGGDSLLQCHFCEDRLPPSQFKNHVINHFKPQLCAYLPGCKPYLCPECRQPSRDKTTLMRHYGFTHKKILEYVTEEDLKGTRVDAHATGEAKAPELKSRKKNNISAGDGSSGEEEIEAKKTKSQGGASVSSSESDAKASSSPAPKKRPSAKNSPEVVAKSPTTINPVKFSDDSDDEFLDKSTTKAIQKSFDELFGDEKNKDDQVQENTNKNGADENEPNGA